MNTIVERKTPLMEDLSWVSLGFVYGESTETLVVSALLVLLMRG